MFTAFTLVLAILAVGFLIVVHEGGHYFVARWCNMRVERFSIGFGPGVVKKVSKKTGTIFQLAPIPFGGFVEIRGMNIAEEVDPEDVHAYPNRPAWQRFLTIFAGPATNYLSAIVLALLMYTCRGVDDPKHATVASVVETFDAHGKLQPGDRLRAVDHVPLVLGDSPGLADRINAAKGAPVTLTIERDGRERDVVVKPQLANQVSARVHDQLLAMGKLEPKLAPLTDAMAKAYPGVLWRIGVVQQQDFQQVGIVDATRAALTYPVIQTKAIAQGLYGIVFGSEKADLGGPIRIAGELQGAFSRSIWDGYRLLLALSVYLGLFNLLPVPALDGGRLVFLAYELVTRRRANPKIEAMVHMAGIMALGVLMIFVMIVDVRRLF